jgi:hypothetical protein
MLHRRTVEEPNCDRHMGREMDTYTLSKIAPTIDGHGFNIVGVHGRPLVYFTTDCADRMSGL